MYWLRSLPAVHEDACGDDSHVRGGEPGDDAASEVDPCCCPSTPLFDQLNGFPFEGREGRVTSQDAYGEEEPPSIGPSEAEREGPKQGENEGSGDVDEECAIGESCAPSLLDPSANQIADNRSGESSDSYQKAAGEQGLSPMRRTAEIKELQDR